jgi:hypothetical protein
VEQYYVCKILYIHMYVFPYTYEYKGNAIRLSVNLIDTHDTVSS